MIQGVIFDLGRTLLEFKGDMDAVEVQGAQRTAEWFRKKKHLKIDVDALAATITTARNEGRARALETLREFRMRDGIVTALRMVDAPAPAETLAEEATRIFFQHEEDQHALVPGALETVKTLWGDKLRVGLLSNATDDALIQRLVNRFNLRPYLSPVFSSAGVGWQKPSAKPFLLIAERWGVAPENIAVVGDTLNADILGAHNAGMRGVLVTYSESPSNDAHRDIIPDAVVESVVQLPTVLRQL